MPTDHTPAEAGPSRVSLEGWDSWFPGPDPEASEMPDEVASAEAIAHHIVAGTVDGVVLARVKHLAETLAAHRCSLPVVPGDTATEGGDVRERALRVMEPDETVWTDTVIGANEVLRNIARRHADALASAGLLAAAGTEGEADLAQAAWLGAQAVINETVQRGFWINEPGEDVLDDLSSAGFSVVEGWALNQPAASPQGEAQGHGEEVWNGDTWFVPAAPGAVAPVGNVDRETLVRAFVKDLYVQRNAASWGADDARHDQLLDDVHHLTDVALAAIRGERR